MLSISYPHRASTGALQTKVTRDVESVEMMSRQMVDVGFVRAVTINRRAGSDRVADALHFYPCSFCRSHDLAFASFMAGKMRRYKRNLRKEVEDEFIGAPG